jgi:hypothetical protein
MVSHPCVSHRAYLSNMITLLLSKIRNERDGQFRG